MIERGLHVLLYLINVKNDKEYGMGWKDSAMWMAGKIISMLAGYEVAKLMDAFSDNSKSKYQIDTFNETLHSSMRDILALGVSASCNGGDSMSLFDDLTTLENKRQLAIQGDTEAMNFFFDLGLTTQDYSKNGMVFIERLSNAVRIGGRKAQDVMRRGGISNSTIRYFQQVGHGVPEEVAKNQRKARQLEAWLIGQALISDGATRPKNFDWSTIMRQSMNGLWNLRWEDFQAAQPKNESDGAKVPNQTEFRGPLSAAPESLKPAADALPSSVFTSGLFPSGGNESEMNDAESDVPVSELLPLSGALGGVDGEWPSDPEISQPWQPVAGSLPPSVLARTLLGTDTPETCADDWDAEGLVRPEIADNAARRQSPRFGVPAALHAPSGNTANGPLFGKKAGGLLEAGATIPVPRGNFGASAGVSRGAHPVTLAESFQGFKDLLTFEPGKAGDDGPRDMRSRLAAFGHYTDVVGNSRSASLMDSLPVAGSEGANRTSNMTNDVKINIQIPPNSTPADYARAIEDAHERSWSLLAAQVQSGVAL